MNESRLYLECTFEVLVSHHGEVSEVATAEKVSSIWAFEYQGAAEHRPHLRHQPESPTSSLGRDGAGAKTRVGLVWS